MYTIITRIYTCSIIVRLNLKEVLRYYKFNTSHIHMNQSGNLSLPRFDNWWSVEQRVSPNFGMGQAQQNLALTRSRMGLSVRRKFLKFRSEIMQPRDFMSSEPRDKDGSRGWGCTHISPPPLRLLQCFSPLSRSLAPFQNQFLQLFRGACPGPPSAAPTIGSRIFLSLTNQQPATVNSRSVSALKFGETWIWGTVPLCPMPHRHTRS